MRIVIDTGAIAHRIRRAFTNVFGRLSPFRCIDCNCRMTADEHYYYGHRCERCEGIAFQALLAESAHQASRFLDAVGAAADAAIAAAPPHPPRSNP